MKDTISIVLSAEAGQGIQTSEDLIMKVASQDFYVSSSSDVMSRVRGGNNTTTIRLGCRPVSGFVHSIDYLFLLNDHAYDRLKDRVHESTIILGEKSAISEEELKAKKASFVELNLAKMAEEAGNKLYANIILFGYIAGMIGLEKDLCQELIRERFSKLKAEIIEGNVAAFDAGYSKGKAQDTGLKRAESFPQMKLLNGTDAVGIGALAGGCNFISAYPMSPGTGLINFLAGNAEEFDVIVEQAEDEIAAINMILGAWYAGARAITTTSGGGFSLMVEGISLAGMIETPCVIHLAQRPGPATGLPTRTEQADLNLALYAGHGEFPRIIFAPGNLEDALRLTQKSFYLADKYQVPVIILTDQYLLDSYGQIEPFSLDDKYLSSSIIETKKDYKRYTLTENGISPRGIPGFGEGLVKVDSDEHDEEGKITEDFIMRGQMNAKRLGKEKLLIEEYTETELIGPKEYKNLIIGWGSTYSVLREYIEQNSPKDTSFLYVKQVYPLPRNLKGVLDKAKTIIVVENNATGQFADLLKLTLDASIDYRVNKFNGEAFSIEEIAKAVEEVIK